MRILPTQRVPGVVHGTRPRARRGRLHPESGTGKNGQGARRDQGQPLLHRQIRNVATFILNC